MVKIICWDFCLFGTPFSEQWRIHTISAIPLDKKTATHTRLQITDNGFDFGLGLWFAWYRFII